MSFEDEVVALASGTCAAPTVAMRMRYRRTWVGEYALLTFIRARAKDSWLLISLYDAGGTDRDRPVVEFFTDPTTEIELVGQGSVCDVIGWPVPGRAVRVEGGGLVYLSFTPCRRPLRGPRLGSS